MEFVKNSVAAGGCEVEYTEGGAGHAVVFLHGGGGFRFDEQTFTALARDYRVLVPSMPGFDGSTSGATQTLEDVGDVMADFISAVIGQPAHVIGESFGGGVATWLAIRHPDVVDRLVLAAPSALRDGSGLSPSTLTPAERFALLYGGRPRDAGRPEDLDRVRRNRANSDRIHAASPDFDQTLANRLGEVRAPTLLLWGSLDRLIPPDHARYYEGIPHKKLVTLEGGPHVLSAGVPEAFVDLAWMRFVEPPLTVIDGAFEAVGQRAAELLLERLGGGGPEGSTEVTVQAHLVIRTSTVGLRPRVRPQIWDHAVSRTIDPPGGPAPARALRVRRAPRRREFNSKGGSRPAT